MTVVTSRPALSPTSRSTVRRLRERAAVDRTALDDVLDAGLVCHLGLVRDGSPLVLPTGYGRDGDTLYLHGSTGAASLVAAAAGTPVCVTVTVLDGIVYARSAMHHSMNYRCAVIHGRLERVTDEAARRHGLRVITEHLAPGSWDHARRPDAKELAATMVLSLDLTEASVKVRTGDPRDDAEDVATNGAWAGVLPVVTTFGAPRPSADLPGGTAIPPHVSGRVVRHDGH